MVLAEEREHGVGGFSLFVNLLGSVYETHTHTQPAMENDKGELVRICPTHGAVRPGAEGDPRKRIPT